MKLAVWPAKLTAPLTAVVPGFRLNVVGLMLAAAIASLKLATIVPLRATPIAPLNGAAELTVGAVTSATGATAAATATLFASNVTAPVRASNRPSTEAPVEAVIDASARMLPLNTE